MVLVNELTIWRKNCLSYDTVFVVYDNGALNKEDLYEYAKKADRLVFISIDEMKRQITIRFFEGDVSIPSCFVGFSAAMHMLLKDFQQLNMSEMQLIIGETPLEFTLSKNKQLLWLDDYFTIEQGAIQLFKGVANPLLGVTKSDTYAKNMYLTEFVAAKPFIDQKLLPIIQPIEVASECFDYFALEAGKVQCRMNYASFDSTRSVVTIFLKKPELEYMNKLEAYVQFNGTEKI